MSKPGLFARRKRPQGYEQIEALFDQALLHQENIQLSEKKQAFLTTVAQLKEHTLYQFSTGHKEFNLDKCLSLAHRTKDLTDKLISNNVNPQQIQQYRDDNEAFKGNSKAVATLVTILAALVGIAAGVAIGFAVGSVAGALCLGFIGGFSGAATARNFFNNRKDPLEQVEDAASQTEYCSVQY